MDNTTLGEMDLEQIPKEFRPNKSEHKSPWAIIIILAAIILFAIFWFVESRDKNETLPAPVSQENTETKTQNNLSENVTGELEASVGAIDIPDYSESL